MGGDISTPNIHIPTMHHPCMHIPTPNIHRPTSIFIFTLLQNQCSNQYSMFILYACKHGQYIYSYEAEPLILELSGRPRKEHRNNIFEINDSIVWNAILDKITLGLFT